MTSFAFDDGTSFMRCSLPRCGAGRRATSFIVIFIDRMTFCAGTRRAVELGRELAIDGLRSLKSPSRSRPQALRGATGGRPDLMECMQ